MRGAEQKVWENILSVGYADWETGILIEVQDECVKQLEKWGVQSHRDICHRGGLGLATADPVREYGPLAAKWKHANGQRFKAGSDDPRYAHMADGPYLAWDGILLEEVFKALEQIGNDAKLREELVQVAAVAASWIEAIDRRAQ